MGTIAGWFPESGRTDLEIPEESGVPARKVLPAQKNLPAWKRLPAEDIAGAVAIASVGINI